MSKPESSIWVEERLPGFHQWPDAPPARRFLADRHRHVFRVQAHVLVRHDDRDVEFFDLSDMVRDWWGPGERECGSASCETLAHQLGDHLLTLDLAVDAVEVSVGDEGGATVRWGR